MFPLVPAHPSCPGQNPESRKTVVCVWCQALKSTSARNYVQLLTFSFS